jgi:diacylglycerol kinase family enzyme
MTDPKRTTLILNKSGGTSRGMDGKQFAELVVKRLEAKGEQCTVKLVSGANLIDALEETAGDKTTGTIIAAGGDGTVSATAATCFRAGKTLGVLPLGTMNLFARSLRLPLDPVAAIDALTSANARDLDIATANGRPFIHQYSVGMHSRLVKLRSGMNTSNKMRKLVSTLAALGKVVLDPPRFDLELTVGSHMQRQILSAISVSNNVLSELPAPYAERLDAGVLGISCSAALGTASAIGVTLDAARGKLEENPNVDIRTEPKVTLTFPSPPKSLKAAIDGEIVALESEVELISHAGALRTLVPVPQSA